MLNKQIFSKTNNFSQIYQFCVESVFDVLPRHQAKDWNKVHQFGSLDTRVMLLYVINVKCVRNCDFSEAVSVVQ